MSEPTTRTRVTATTLYPGSFFSEDGRTVEVPNASPETVLAAVPDDGKWFALTVSTTTQKRWTDGTGDEMWYPTGPPSSYRIYVGESLTADDVERLPGDHSILLSNMRGNGWKRVVRTRRGNFQPVEARDVVTPALNPAPPDEPTP